MKAQKVRNTNPTWEMSKQETSIFRKELSYGCDSAKIAHYSFLSTGIYFLKLIGCTWI
jgi:hypothetical protein